MWDQNYNVIQISKNKLNNAIYIPYDFTFTKHNVEYDIDLIFPNGSLLRNYRDEQIPIIPFEFEDYKIEKAIQSNNYQIKKEIIINNKKSQNKLLDKVRFEAKNKNNELRSNIDYGHFKNQIDELKENIILMNSNNNKQIRGTFNNRYQSKKDEYHEKKINQKNNNFQNWDNYNYLYQINEENEINNTSKSEGNNDALNQDMLYNNSKYINNNNNQFPLNNDIQKTIQNNNFEGYEKDDNHLASQHSMVKGYENMENIINNNLQNQNDSTNKKNIQQNYDEQNSNINLESNINKLNNENYININFGDNIKNERNNNFFHFLHFHFLDF